jgi:hypothetical protein
VSKHFNPHRPRATAPASLHHAGLQAPDWEWLWLPAVVARESSSIQVKKDSRPGKSCANSYTNNSILRASIDTGGLRNRALSDLRIKRFHDHARCDEATLANLGGAPNSDYRTQKAPRFSKWQTKNAFCKKFLSVLRFLLGAIPGFPVQPA